MDNINAILETAIQTTPTWQTEHVFCPSAAEFAHIQAISYDGLTVESGKTTTFAYLGIPKGATAEEPVPAIILVHGGDGQAFLPWVKIWNERGYAAIAMSTRGGSPTELMPIAICPTIPATVTACTIALSRKAMWTPPTRTACTTQCSPL